MAQQLVADDETSAAAPPATHVPGRQTRGRRVGEEVIVWAIRIGVLVGVFAVWEWVLAPNLSRLSFTSATRAFEATWTFVTGDTFWSSSWVTLQSTLIGLAIGAGLGAAIAMIWVRLPATVAATLEPFIAGFYAMPRIAFLPVLALVVGRGLSTALIYIVAGIIFYIFFSVRAGLLERDVAGENAIRMMGGSELQVVRYVQLPRVLGSLVTGLLIAAPFAIQLALSAELLIGSEGLGFLITYGKNYRIVDLMFAAIIVASFWSLMIDVFVRLGLAVTRRLHVAE